MAPSDLEGLGFGVFHLQGLGAPVGLFSLQSWLGWVLLAILRKSPSPTAQPPAPLGAPVGSSRMPLPFTCDSPCRLLRGDTLSSLD